MALEMQSRRCQRSRQMKERFRIHGHDCGILEAGFLFYGGEVG